MHTDKTKFEQIDGYVYFRPQIPGEFNEQKMLGYDVPMIGPLAGFMPEACTWTAVVDLVRAYRVGNDEPPGKPSGCRTRYKCMPVLTAEQEEISSQVALSLALEQLTILRNAGKEP